MLRHTGPGKHALLSSRYLPGNQLQPFRFKHFEPIWPDIPMAVFPDNITWTNIAGATAATLTTQQNAATWYRLQVTCSGNTGSSAPLLVPMSAPTACYCLPPITNCNLDDEITNVTFGGINNNSTCGLNGYTNYTNLPAGQAYSGAANPMSVTVGPGGTERGVDRLQP